MVEAHDDKPTGAAPNYRHARDLVVRIQWFVEQIFQFRFAAVPRNQVGIVRRLNVQDVPTAVDSYSCPQNGMSRTKHAVCFTEYIDVE